MKKDVFSVRSAGYSYFVEHFNLKVIPHWHSSSVSASGTHRTIVNGRFSEEIFPHGYWPGDSLGGQLEFALKYDGIN